jgi:hypothetical protein
VVSQIYKYTVPLFRLVLQFPPTNKAGLHDIAEILLKVALNTITLF